MVSDAVDSDGSTEEVNAEDSIELTQLVRHVYKWRLANELDDFPYEVDSKSPEIFIGIDWKIYDRNIRTLESTNFFSEEFFRTHRNIALSLDSSIRKADIEWRNFEDGIPLWSPDADDWCSCQDYPDDYWKILTITNLELEDQIASFNWTWDTGPTDYPHYYPVTAKKENIKWKITWLNGFNNYQSAEYYDEIMKKK